jgi:ribosomal protein S18 acetylase RimI-like enzyme
MANAAFNKSNRDEAALISVDTRNDGTVATRGAGEPFWRLGELFARYGVGATLTHLGHAASSRLTPLVWLNALALTPDHVDTGLEAQEGQITGRMLDAIALRPYARDPNVLFGDEFLTEAIAHGDRCYALFDGEALVSYSWYSTRAKRLWEMDPSLAVYFDPSFAYMYSSYTDPRYRGRGLQGRGGVAALRAAVSQGLKGLVCYVNSSNLASLRACHRLGYVTFGRILTLRLGHRLVCLGTPGCKRYGLRIGPVEGASP